MFVINRLWRLYRIRTFHLIENISLEKSFSVVIFLARHLFVLFVRNLIV